LTTITTKMTETQKQEYNRKKQELQKLIDQETSRKQQRRRQKTCYKCRQKGHIAKNCTNNEQIKPHVKNHTNKQSTNEIDQMIRDLQRESDDRMDKMFERLRQDYNNTYTGLIKEKNQTIQVTNELIVPQQETIDELAEENNQLKQKIAD